jgi:hypothetical protein
VGSNPTPSARVVAPKSVVAVDGERVTIPLKTLESLNFYVLNDFLERIGFIDWARKQEGFVFASLHDGVIDPEKPLLNEWGVCLTAPGLAVCSSRRFTA